MDLKNKEALRAFLFLSLTVKPEPSQEPWA
jgi:hypothetical protein